MLMLSPARATVGPSSGKKGASAPGTEHVLLLLLPALVCFIIIFCLLGLLPLLLLLLANIEHLDRFFFTFAG